MEEGCIFCQQQPGVTFEQILRHGEHCFVVYDNCPVTPGHRLIISKDHYRDWFSAPPEVQQEIMELIGLEAERLVDGSTPEGFNVGFNCGEVAGQTVMHLHVHLIPRKVGDTENPRGGVRGVIPARQSYAAPSTGSAGADES